MWPLITLSGRQWCWLLGLWELVDLGAQEVLAPQTHPCRAQAQIHDPNHDPAPSAPCPWELPLSALRGRRHHLPVLLRRIKRFQQNNPYKPILIEEGCCLVCPAGWSQWGSPSTDCPEPDLPAEHSQLLTGLVPRHGPTPCGCAPFI